MPAVQPYAAIDVEPGWALLHDGKVRTVTDKHVDPKRPGEIERVVWLFMPGVDWVKGDATRTVYKVSEET